MMSVSLNQPHFRIEDLQLETSLCEEESKTHLKNLNIEMSRLGAVINDLHKDNQKLIQENKEKQSELIDSSARIRRYQVLIRSRPYFEVEQRDILISYQKMQIENLMIRQELLEEANQQLKEMIIELRYPQNKVTSQEKNLITKDLQESPKSQILLPRTSPTEEDLLKKEIEHKDPKGSQKPLSLRFVEPGFHNKKNGSPFI